MAIIPLSIPFSDFKYSEVVNPEEFDSNNNAIQTKVNEVVADIEGNRIITGSNTNGTYIKYPDGTLICHIYITPTDQAINTPYGSLFQGSRTWTFPMPFVANPSVHCSEFKWGTGASWGTVGASGSTTNAVLRGIDILSRATGATVTISAMAIGKWK